MKICALIRMVPDLVEELEIDESGTEIFPSMYIANERDEQAVEEAIILKEKHGGSVEVVGIADDETSAEIDEPLAMAVAKGADKAVKLNLSRPTYKRAELAKALAEFLKEREYDLILVGIQAIDSFAGILGPMLATYMGLPYIGNAVYAELKDGYLLVRKELEGGVMGEYKVKLPAVVGIISAEKPPRFVPFAKLRQVKKSMEIEEFDIDIPEIEGLEVERYYEPPKPEIVLIEGEAEEVAEKLVEVMKEIGIL